MAANMKENTKRIRRTEKELKTLPQEVDIPVNMPMAKEMDKGLIIGLMETNMKDNLKKVYSMDKEPIIMPMETNM